MKFTLSWLKEHLETDRSLDEICATLSMIGLEVEGVEKVSGGFDGIVVAEVLSKEPHPDADRLSLCKVNDGTGERQIVCGATNFKVGSKVSLAMPGCEMPTEPGAKPFKIKVGKIRGVESQGMMCSSKELGLAEDAEGLMILPEEAQVGQSFAEHLGRIGDWPTMVADAGMASFHFVNTSGYGLLVAPFGGIDRRLSANPIAAGVPVEGKKPIILDISTCAIAEGKLKVALNKGVEVEPGCIMDNAGNAITDPAQFYTDPPGVLLPFGGHKGYGLSVIAEMFAGALTGNSCSNPDNDQRPPARGTRLRRRGPALHRLRKKRAQSAWF